MTTDKVIEIAKRCGFSSAAAFSYADDFSAFAAEVERQTAEACAKVCDHVPIRVGNAGIWGNEVKDAIRAGKYKEFIE